MLDFPVCFLFFIASFRISFTLISRLTIHSELCNFYWHSLSFEGEGGCCIFLSWPAVSMFSSPSPSASNFFVLSTNSFALRLHSPFVLFLGCAGGVSCTFLANVFTPTPFHSLLLLSYYLIKSFWNFPSFFFLLHSLVLILHCYLLKRMNKLRDFFFHRNTIILLRFLLCRAKIFILFAISSPFSCFIHIFTASSFFNYIF